MMAVSLVMTAVSLVLAHAESIMLVVIVLVAVIHIVGIATEAETSEDDGRPSRRALKPGYADSIEHLDRIAEGIYLHLGYTIHRSDRQGYEHRWFVFKEEPPGRRWVHLPDGHLRTFGSAQDAAAWLDENLLVRSDVKSTLSTGPRPSGRRGS